MTPIAPDSVRRVFLVELQGERYVIYNAAEINNPFDHQPDKWYVMPYPVPVGMKAGPAFETAEEAEQSLRRRRTRYDH